MENIKTYKSNFLEKIKNYNTYQFNQTRLTLKVLLEKKFNLPLFPYHFFNKDIDEEVQNEDRIYTYFGFNHICTFANPNYNKSNDIPLPLNNKGLRELVTSVLNVDNHIIRILIDKITNSTDDSKWIKQNLRINSDIYFIVNFNVYNNRF